MGRNEEIARRHLAGETLTEIGNDLGLTRERVRQIVAARRPTIDWIARQGEARRLVRAVGVIARRALRDQRAEHGTTARYRRGCTCDECRAANADYYREYAHRVGRSKRHRPVAQREAIRAGMYRAGMYKEGVKR